MSTEFFRKYVDLITEAENSVLTQEELTELYNKGQEVQFIKNTPVALIPFSQLQTVATPDQAEKIMQAAGNVDQTSYQDAYKQKGYIVFQMNKGAPDIYIVSPEVIQSKYAKFNGQLPTDEKAISKVPSLLALRHFGLDFSKIPFYVKKVPTNMVTAKSLGIEGSRIQTNWGEQTVSPGGFLVKEENGHIYTVAPNEHGLPIGYVPATLSENSNNPVALDSASPISGRNKRPKLYSPTEFNKRYKKKEQK